ncbi:TPA: ATP synthase F1 subunit delta [Candidatus Berkelbacteria bacterium]|uniref:ATP synthase subunit delta n=1 Tax=Berkelbacteria bacterium GW2011_GWE1_39_12 TaxID=1618337 RepID=A0A0G4B2W7_9BACT|nr:MAG: ATP synthase subunit delta [Berkelbacteria bacterium GW2011_GWE1_39_12]HBO60872.1 ATP synthase F1 subunit delta [Candidatus Berkelbacteria bacterium]
MSYTPKQLADSYTEKSKDGLIELMMLEKVFALNSFKKMMFNPKLSIDKKKTIVNELFSENFNKNTLNFLIFLTEENGLKNFSKIVNEFKKILRDEKTALSGLVTSSSALSNEEIENLENDLEIKMSVPVVLESRVSPELLGGVIVEIDGLSYDNSFQSKLKKLVS